MASEGAIAQSVEQLAQAENKLVFELRAKHAEYFHEASDRRDTMQNIHAVDHASLLENSAIGSAVSFLSMICRIVTSRFIIVLGQGRACRF